MKIKVIVWMVFFACSFTMKAQGQFYADFNLKSEPTDKIDFNEANVRISVAKKIDDENEVTNTTEYTNLKIKYEAGAYYDFENLTQFNRIQNKFEISHKGSNVSKLNLAITPAINFQQNFGISDLNFLGSFILNQQLSSKTAINIGIERSTAFGSPKFIPTLSFSAKINNQTNVLIGFPDSKISYSNNVRNKFSMSNSFNGSYYNLDDSFDLYNNTARISISQMTTALEYERNVDTGWFINLKAGYDFDKKYNLLDDNNHKLYDFNTGNGYILSIGIKYKQ